MANTRPLCYSLSTTPLSSGSCAWARVRNSGLVSVGQAAAWVCSHSTHEGWHPALCSAARASGQWALGKGWVSSHRVLGRQAAGHRRSHMVIPGG